MSKSLNSIRGRLGGVRESLSVGPEVRLQNDIYRFSQKQHLAASLFSLDEIAIVPKVLTPLIQSPRAIELAPTDSVSLTIPYVPDWPELGSIYKTSTMTLLEALQGGTNIILVGHPGSGKTVALAWLSSCIVRNDPGLGNLAGLLPIYIHATQLHYLYEHIGSGSNDSESMEDGSLGNVAHNRNKVNNANQAVELLIEAISTYVSPLTLTKLPRVIRSALENQQAIILLDRVDELPPQQALKVTNFLQLLIEKYPELRIVVAMSYDNLAGLPSIGFSLLAMAAWGDEERTTFAQLWSQQWGKWILPAEKFQSAQLYSHYLKSWLSIDNTLFKPFEFTLKIWAAYAGDIIGPGSSDAIEAYIRRMTRDIPNARPVLEQFALQLLIEMGITANPNTPDLLISKYKNALKSTVPDTSSNGEDPKQSLPARHHFYKDIPWINSLTENGLLINYQNSHYSFSHPIICGYLAGKALSEIIMINHLQDQPSWMMKNLSMGYLAQYGDVTPLIQYYLSDDDILYTHLLLIARWLQVAPKNRPWRTFVLRRLASILQKERETINLAIKIVVAMSFSGDQGVAIYFRQLLKSESPNLKQLSALGCGILADKKAIDDLFQLLQEQSPASIRSACLALAAIGDKQCLEILASNLLNGSELVRRYAAEALANNPVEGHPALQEGSSMEDLLVRRSVVFGLIRVDQPWARKIVENLQLDDNEWVVRNAAIQAFDELNRKSSYAPKSLPDLTETKWLIEYASRIGTTVAPGKPAEELVRKALTSGNPDEKLNAIDYLRNKCDPKAMDLIYTTYKNSTGELRASAYYLLWLMTITGIKLPYSFE